MNALGIQIPDIVVVVFILISALWAFARGFVREILGVGAWLGAALVTLYLFNPVRLYLRSFISVEIAADIAAGVGLFLITLILLSMLSHSISRLVRGSMLSPLDRSLGFVFGLARGAVLVCLGYLVVIWALHSSTPPAWLSSAKTLPAIQQGAQLLKSLLPSDARDQGATAAENARRQGERALELEQSLRALTSPPVKGDGTRDGAGYDNGERRDLDRLIQGEQKQDGEQGQN
jgi:membrane protein required for colicin V production